MNYPYSTSTGSISKILKKIQNVGQPKKVDGKWFASIGFTKTSEKRMIAVLKFIGFAEANGTPTSLWSKFRSTKTGKSMLGQALIKAYSELFNIYPNAQEIGRDELLDFFKTRSTAGNMVLTHTVNTFKNMASFAEFTENEVIENTELETESGELSEDVLQQADTNSNQLSKQILTSKKGLTINLNIQLNVPETTDGNVYDKFFKSMKKHLLS